jgi:D-alanine-D-alanine ligase
MRKFSFQRVVVVADLWEEGRDSTPLFLRRDLEKTDPSTLQQLISAIASLGLEVCHYQEPESLARHAEQHRDDIVLSLYGGSESRNRVALVPAVCESFGLRFIGADTFGRVIAQDKEVSKRLAVDCGLLTPPWRIVRSDADIGYVSGLAAPVVVKPLLEGSSIGISQRNLVSDLEQARQLAAELLVEFRQPILIEEFVAGREVAYSRIERCGPDAWALSEVVISGNPHHFHERLFDANEKMRPTPGRTVVNIDADLCHEDHVALEKFLAAYGEFGYCRIDGRLSNGRFQFIELTPDAWISPRGQFARGFTEKGWRYPEVIAAVLASSG